MFNDPPNKIGKSSRLIEFDKNRWLNQTVQKRANGRLPIGEVDRWLTNEQRNGDIDRIADWLDDIVWAVQSSRVQSRYPVTHAQHWPTIATSDPGIRFISCSPPRARCQALTNFHRQHSYPKFKPTDFKTGSNRAPPLTAAVNLIQFQKPSKPPTQPDLLLKPTNRRSNRFQP